MSTPWHSAPIASRRPAAEGLVHLSLDVRGTPVAGAHALPGQYVKLSLPGVGEGYFAIASAPGETEQLDFLVKRASPLTEALAEVSVGHSVHVSPPAGKGFPVDKARSKDVLLFATGSGIAAIRPVIELVRRERKAYGRVTLYFGAREPRFFAYSEEIPTWEKHDIQVLRTVSKPSGHNWHGPTGYVQQHIGNNDLSQAVAFLVGQKGMVAEVSKVLVERGLPGESIHLNF